MSSQEQKESGLVYFRSEFRSKLSSWAASHEDTVFPLKSVWWGDGEKPDEEDAAVRPFKIAVPDSEVEDLKLRLKLTRLPKTFPAKNWEHGVDFDYLTELLEHWRNKYNWREHEARLNENLPQFITNIDGIDLHFAHVKSDAADAIPLIVCHGWPSSFWEFEKIVPLLTSGDGGRQAFHVVAPSMPGYGFSSQAQRLGMNHVQVAAVFSKLMARLGYEKYVAHGGDWGVIVSSDLGHVDPDHVKGIHVTLAAALPPPNADKIELSDEVKQKLAKHGWEWDEKGYMHMHATKPHTIGAALADSPIGLAAWIVEKFQSWTDCHGDIKSSASMDELLTNVMIYWFSNSITSSMRFYKENSLEPDHKHKITRPEVLQSFLQPINTPFGVASFPVEVFYVPRKFAEAHFTNIVTFNHYEKGGHFPAFEVPEILAEDIRQFAAAAKVNEN